MADIELIIRIPEELTRQKIFTNVDLIQTIAPSVHNGIPIDKIRADIEGLTPTYHSPDWSITDLVPISKVLKCIDKYKTESEDKE